MLLEWPNVTTDHLPNIATVLCRNFFIKLLNWSVLLICYMTSFAKSYPLFNLHFTSFFWKENARKPTTSKSKILFIGYISPLRLHILIKSHSSSYSLKSPLTNDIWRLILALSILSKHLTMYRIRSAWMQICLLHTHLELIY